MRAFVRKSQNHQKIKLAKVPKPSPASDEVLIKVANFGVGIHDRYFIPTGVTFPYVIGSEGSGEIIELGAEVEKFKLGDRVIFTTILQPKGGSWAEYAIAKASALSHLPDNLSFAEGAALPVAGKTALECIRELQLEKDERLFIAGASGAIGTYVIQLAAAKGIKIAASASAKNHEYMRQLGVDFAVDYRNDNWQSEIKKWASGGVNVALAIQVGTAKDSIEVVKDNGRLITVSGDHSQVETERGITIKQMEHHSTKQDFLHLVDLVSQNKIKIEIEKAFPFDKTLSALEKQKLVMQEGKS